MYTLALLAWIAGATPNEPLHRAEELLQDARYGAALKAVEAAARVEGNDRPTTLRIYELEGLLAATLNQEARAGRAFRALLVLDSQRKLPPDQPPRVTTPFYEAKAWAEENGRLIVDSVSGRVAVVVRKNPLSLARKVRFHLRVAGEWAIQESELEKGETGLKINLPAEAWWAEVLGERDAVLADVCSEAEPMVLKPAASAPAAPKETPPVEVAPPPPAAVVVEPPAATSPLRPAAYAVGGVGLVAVGVGAYFGVRTSSERAQLNSVARDAQGRVTGMTQKQAFSLDAAARQDAIVANTLMIAGGGLCAAGVGLWLLGGTVQAAPAPGGLSVSGRF